MSEREGVSSAQDRDVLLAEAATSANRGEFDHALRIYVRLLEQNARDVTAAAGLAQCLFALERWDEAWKAYEIRFALMERPVATRRRADGQTEPFPTWRHGPPPKRLLVLPEQGIGDTIQFMRYVPRLVEAGVAVQMVVHPRIARLVRPSLDGVRVLVSEGNGQAKGVDAFCSLLELPGLLRLRPQDFVPRMPYLFVEADRVYRWARELVDPGKLNIGIAWQGNRRMPSDATRSAPLAAFAPLAAVENVRLISLQTGDGVDQVLAVPFGDRVACPSAGFDAGPDAFLDTAALMAGLDLVISVDTAICHLAGALGRPVWIALRADGPDWRWLARPHDTPWYPSARLYRQTTAGDWIGVFRRVAGDLDAFRRQVPVFLSSPAADRSASGT